MNLFDDDYEGRELMRDWAEYQQEKIEDAEWEHDMYFRYGSNEDYERRYGSFSIIDTILDKLGFLIFVAVVGWMIF